MRTSMLTAVPLLLGSASAFAPATTPCAASVCAPRSAVPVCVVEDDAIVNRRAVLAGLAGAVIGAGARPALAGYVYSLGIETTKPSDADIDDELLKSKAVQDALGNLKTAKSSAQSLKGMWDKDPNMALIPYTRKYFDFSKLRDDLNVVGSVFDDATQETIDRLARAILYDVTELENAARFKKGAEQVRTEKMLASVGKWFSKLDGDFDQLLKYF